MNYQLICSYKGQPNSDYWTYSFSSESARFQFIRLNGEKLAYIKLYESSNVIERGV